ncbi:MAG: type II toxin-antitoxin system HicA family toxin [Lachnospira sp.]
MKKILRANGYEYIRCKGSHFMYSNGTNTIAVNKDLNCMVARRLMKQYNLECAK